jgi:hypothetical protein
MYDIRGKRSRCQKKAWERQRISYVSIGREEEHYNFGKELLNDWIRSI